MYRLSDTEQQEIQTLYSFLTGINMTNLRQRIVLVPSPELQVGFLSRLEQTKSVAQGLWSKAIHQQYASQAEYDKAVGYLRSSGPNLVSSLANDVERVLNDPAGKKAREDLEKLFKQKSEGIIEQRKEEERQEQEGQKSIFAQILDEFGEEAKKKLMPVVYVGVIIAGVWFFAPIVRAWAVKRTRGGRKPGDLQPGTIPQPGE